MTIDFKNCCQKYPRGISGRKFEDYFCAKFFLSTNLRVQISNFFSDFFCFARNFEFWKIRESWREIRPFFKWQLKNTQIRCFWSEFIFFLFQMKLCVLKNSRVLISDITIVFKMAAHKYRNNMILVPIFLRILVCFDKFWGADICMEIVLDENCFCKIKP